MWMGVTRERMEWNLKKAGEIGRGLPMVVSRTWHVIGGLESACAIVDEDEDEDSGDADGEEGFK
jgi:hypothetical protein